VNLLEVSFIHRYLDRTLLCSVKTGEPRVALTFDDGPNPNHTPKLLDLLRKRMVRATFFLVGKRVRRHPELARRIAEEGHEIGNHGMNHVPVILLPPALVESEARRAGELLEEVTGKRPRFFRPPMGWFHAPGLKRLRELGYQPVIGNIHPRDFTGPGIDVIVDFVMERLVPGSIVILHDGGWRDGVDRSQTIAATERLIDHLEERKYRLQTLSELVGETA
jgi:peptidoglycan/xylan/chitin deacetylase (PgdA/CDA1 family)